MAGQLCSVPVLALLVLLLVALLPPVWSQFTARPNSSITLNEGDSFSTSCDYPDAFTLVWRRNDVTIAADDHRFQLETMGHMSTLGIASVDHALHMGSYSCVAVLNNSMQVYANFSITVNYIGSEISIRRVNTGCSPDIYEGSFFTLECIPPDGFPQVSVTWYRGGDKIRQNAGDPAVDFSNSRRMLTINPVSFTHVGEYHCEAANEVNQGSPLESELLEILVLHPEIDPEGSVAILSSSQPQLVGEGRNTRLVCQIIPIPDINDVQWFRNGQPLTHTGNDIRIVQNNSFPCYVNLYIDNVTAEREGVYECRDSTMTHLSAQRQVSIAHLSGPIVVEATPSGLVGQGQQLSLECRLAEDADSSANNVPPQDFLYSWSLNGTEIEADGGRLLEVTATSLSQSGRYGCMVNHPEITTPITAFINITVEAPPQVTLTSSPSPQVQLGSTVTLHCHTSSPRPSSFTWLNNNSAVQEDSRHAVSSLPDSSMLTISHLQLTDLQHSYWCVANDSVHQLQRSIQLSESGQLYIVGAMAGPQDRFFPIGSTLSLVCVTRNGEGRSVVWFQGNRLLSNHSVAGAGKALIVSNDSSSTLSIPGTTTSEAGDYSCMTVDGNTGTESRLGFSVTITVPGKIVSTSRYRVEAVVGDRVQFDCFTSGIPPPTVNWLYQSRPIPSLDEDSIMDKGNGTLVIDSVRLDLAGVYYCLVDSKSANFTLKVETASTEEDSSGGCGTFSRTECIILSSVGAVAILLILLTAGMVMLCACVLYRRWKRGSYPIAREMDGVELKRTDSSRASIRKDNSGIFTSAASNTLFGDQFVSNHYGKSLYPPSLPITPYGGSVISEMRHSITPPAPSPVPQTPGTAGTDSLFSSDDQSSLAASLPNFPRTNLKLGEEMGEGEFGPVILGVAKNILPHEEKTQVAVKVLVRGGEGDDHFRPDLALVDFANQMKLDYEHIACIIGLCTDTEPYYVLYEYLDQGDLKKYLLSNQPTEDSPSQLTQQILSRTVLQVADGMAYLFSQRIIHGDLAARNCLISSDHRVKIADLGIGHDLYSSDYYDNGSQLLPIRWMPPELLLQTEGGPSFSLHSDIWSFGVLCWEVFTFARLPYEDWSDQEVLEQVPLGELLPVPAEGCPAHMYSVMVQCWHQDPETRPRFAKLCMAIMNMGLD